MREEDEGFSARLRRLRIRRGLSQRDLAAPGVSHAYISRLESGARRPSVSAIRVLADRLGVSVEYLETGVDISPAEALELRLVSAELALRLGEDGDDQVEALQAVLVEAEEKGRSEIAARARAALGLAAFGRGEHVVALEHLEAARTSPIVTPASQPNVFLALAKTQLFLGHAEKAIQLLEEALAELEGEPCDPGVRIRYATQLSAALARIGEHGHAREVLRPMLDSVESDAKARIRILWTRALLSYREGDFRIAMGGMRDAIALLDSTEDTIERARAHLFCAELSIWGDDLATASTHVGLARELYRLPAAQRDVGVLASCEALLYARRDRFAAARRKAMVAFVLLEQTPADQGIAWTALALAAAGEGDVTAADQAFRKGIDVLAGADEFHEAVAVCRSWERVLAGAGRTQEAAGAAERAADLAVRAHIAHHRRALDRQRLEGRR